MKLTSDSRVAPVFDSYSNAVHEKCLALRQLIIDTASETDGVTALEETLKWGEPSYLTKSGSTIRIAWVPSQPRSYGLYFNCKTSLVETFKECYSDTFNFKDNRAIIFDSEDVVPIEQLKHCITLSLTYHNIKHLPLLGC